MANEPYSQNPEEGNLRPFGDTSLGVSLGRSIAGLSLASGVWIVLKALEGIITVIR